MKKSRTDEEWFEWCEEMESRRDMTPLESVTVMPSGQGAPIGSTNE